MISFAAKFSTKTRTTRLGGVPGFALS